MAINIGGMVLNSCTRDFIDDSSFLEKIKELHESDKCSDRILARFGNIVLVPTALITTALDTLICLGAGLGALCTLGTKKKLIDRIIVHGEGSAEILAEPYLQLLTAISPSDPDYARPGDALFTTLLQPLYKISDNLFRSPNFFKREVASRLTIALSVVSMLITRIFDLTIGMAFTPVSLLFLGKIKIFNTVAYNGLLGAGIIADITLLSMALINPEYLYYKKQS